MPRITMPTAYWPGGPDEDRELHLHCPARDDMFILGGYAEPDEWSLDIGLNDYEPIREMNHARRFHAALRRARVDATDRSGSAPDRSALKTSAST